MKGSIRTCFCTGVLPVTMDDLTSGYNIAEILTLEPNFLNMLGFTYEETETYLRYVLDKYAAGQDRYDEIWQLIVSNYDGYRFRPNGERLFNSTILTYFFKSSLLMPVAFRMSWLTRIYVQTLTGYVVLLYRWIMLKRCWTH